MPDLHLLQEASRGDYLISTDPTKLDLDVVYSYLHDTAYWCKGIERWKVERMVKHSLCYGVYVYHHNQTQIGFTRVLTDYTTYAYLADVFILPTHQGQGLGVWLIDTILQHPELQGLRTWALKTDDAHELYAKFGFKTIATVAKHMEYKPDA